MERYENSRRGRERYCRSMGVRTPKESKHKKKEILMFSIIRYTGNKAERGAKPDKIVIKQALEENMNNESAMLEYLQNSSSKHIVRMISNSQRVKINDPMAISDNDWVGNVGRIYLEYCSLHDLWGLVNFRSPR